MTLEGLIYTVIIGGILAAGFVGTLFVPVLILIEVCRSLWDLRSRWLRVLRFQVVVGVVLWMVLGIFLVFVLGGGVFGFIAFMYLLGVGIIALAHIPEAPRRERRSPEAVPGAGV
jgi:hypothetical protein